jgi:hypothetical protein
LTLAACRRSRCGTNLGRNWAKVRFFLGDQRTSLRAQAPGVGHEFAAALIGDELAPELALPAQHVPGLLGVGKSGEGLRILLFAHVCPRAGLAAGGFRGRTSGKSTSGDIYEQGVVELALSLSKERQRAFVAAIPDIYAPSPGRHTSGHILSVSVGGWHLRDIPHV